MGVQRASLALVIAAGVAGGAGCVGENPSQPAGNMVKGGSNETGQYTASVDWWKPAADHTPRADCPAQGDGGGSNYVVEVDAHGNIIKNWSKWDTLFNAPHQVYISPYDPERHIYIVERGGKQPGPNGVDVHEAVYKFTNDGETLVWALQAPSTSCTASPWTARVGSTWVTASTTGSRCSPPKASLSRSGRT